LLDVFRTRTAWDSTTRHSLLLLSFPLVVFLLPIKDRIRFLKYLQMNHNVEGRSATSLTYERVVGREA